MIYKCHGGSDPCQDKETKLIGRISFFPARFKLFFLLYALAKGVAYSFKKTLPFLYRYKILTVCGGRVNCGQLKIVRVNLTENQWDNLNFRGVLSDKPAQHYCLEGIRSQRHFFKTQSLGHL